MSVILGSKEAYKYDKNSYTGVIWGVHVVTGAIKWKMEIKMERSNARFEWLPARCTFTSVLPASCTAKNFVCLEVKIFNVTGFGHKN